MGIWIQGNYRPGPPVVAAFLYLVVRDDGRYQRPWEAASRDSRGWLLIMGLPTTGRQGAHVPDQRGQRF